MLGGGATPRICAVECACRDAVGALLRTHASMPPRALGICAAEEGEARCAQNEASLAVMPDWIAHWNVFLRVAAAGPSAAQPPRLHMAPRLPPWAAATASCMA